MLSPTDLGAGKMQTVGPVDLDPALVVCVDQLVRHGMVHHCLGHLLVVAKHHLTRAGVRHSNTTTKSTHSL